MEIMDRQEKLSDISRNIKDFEERFQKIVISKDKSSPKFCSGDSFPLPSATSEFYKGRVPSITLSKDLQNVIILKELQNNPNFKTGVSPEELGNRGLPQSSKDMTLNFSREERLLLYDYCVSATGHHSTPEIPFSYPIDTPSSSSTSTTDGPSRKTVTFAEIAAMEKQRKKKQRRKSAKDKQRTPRVTYTDELRGLIDTQMRAWEAFLREKSRTRHSDRHLDRSRTAVKRLK